MGSNEPIEPTITRALDTQLTTKWLTHAILLDITENTCCADPGYFLGVFYNEIIQNYFAESFSVNWAMNFEFPTYFSIDHTS